MAGLRLTPSQLAVQLCFRRATCRPSSNVLLRWNSTSAPSPPLLGQLRNDLKASMKEKKSERLLVLRGLLSDVTNASKTTSPIQSDAQFLTLVKKRLKISNDASAEFQGAGRTDLVEKEDGKAKVLQEYVDAASSGMASDDEIRAIIEKVLAGLKSQKESIKMGQVIQKCWDEEGLSGKAEKSSVARLVKNALEK